jgi:hypothetical protein
MEREMVAQWLPAPYRAIVFSLEGNLESSRSFILKSANPRVGGVPGLETRSKLQLLNSPTP